MRWLVLAGGPRAAAERFASSLGGEYDVIGRADLRASLTRWSWRNDCRTFDALAIHSPDWRRQRAPQLYEFAAAIAPVRRRLLADDASGVVRQLGSAELSARVAAVPFAVATALLRSGGELARLSRVRLGIGHRTTTRNTFPTGAIIAIWVGDPGDEVGGSVTHVSGILSGFRKAGLRIGLVTVGAPPPQLARVVDDVQIASPLPAGARLTSDVEALALNRTLRSAATALAGRLGPAIVYQRHRAFLTAGLDVAHGSNMGFVLEWNSSEAWTRAHWGERASAACLFDPLIRGMETYICERADLTVAVSAAAAEAAIEMGAPHEKVIVVPNAVDVEEVDGILSTLSNDERETPRQPSIGWIGSFDLFHGVEVLIEALALLPTRVRCVLIGDGPRRVPSEELAQSLGVADRIEWTGALPHAEALRRLAGCDVLTSPHPPLADRMFFGSPTKIFEYLALGRPIVASDLGQIGEVLEDGRTARLVTPGDARALADGILDVLNSPDRGAELGRAARREAERSHTWDRRARAILDRMGAVSGQVRG